MCKIYVDFDGVLVDTPKIICKEIERNGNCIETFKNLSWDYCLSNCNEIENNIKYLQQLLQKQEITILTHVYSEKEKSKKSKFISKKIGNINVIAVPYFLKKNEMVEAEGNVLIDDCFSNILSWESAGGIGILFDKERKLENILLEMETKLYE